MADTLGVLRFHFKKAFMLTPQWEKATRPPLYILFRVRVRVRVKVRVMHSEWVARTFCIKWNLICFMIRSFLEPYFSMCKARVTIILTLAGCLYRIKWGHFASKLLCVGVIQDQKVSSLLFYLKTHILPFQWLKNWANFVNMFYLIILK